MILALSCLHGEAGEKCSLTNELSFHSRRWGRQGAVGSTAAGASAARLPVGVREADSSELVEGWALHLLRHFWPGFPS